MVPLLARLHKVVARRTFAHTKRIVPTRDVLALCLSALPSSAVFGRGVAARGEVDDDHTRHTPAWRTAHGAPWPVREKSAHGGDGGQSEHRVCARDCDERGAADAALSVGTYQGYTVHKWRAPYPSHPAE